ncbi:MAG: 2-amino-4-hydroxy-6-hydroxymethyldihydropteridine diphosphokinase [Gammaproteobacteria bacterium]|nr:2-amino-4-hydroxy-6-hydroxymethyldihydropteridine diphosphokinase [Gammaproteobacteria bacterium]
MTQVYVSVGSNINRETMVRSCIAELDETFDGLVKSSVYESIAVGFEGDNFYNLVVGFKADDPREVARILRAIELAHGRHRGEKQFAPRTLDLDLLLFGDLDLHSQGLDVPRNEIIRYAFVLGPLAELAPEAIHPSLKKSYQDLWSEYCRDNPEQADSIWPVTFLW